MPPPDDPIDRLYQQPLEQFIAARTALAHEAGKADAALVKSLQKPNVVAWALNQLYWSARPVFDRLAAAAAKLRSAQADVLLGRAADLRAADAEHRKVLREALDATAAILEGAGHAVTPDTIRTVTAALEALPWRDQPGRLVRPPAGMGFEALAGLPFAPAPEQPAPSKLPSVPPSAGTEGPATGRTAGRERAARERAERTRAREQERERRERLAAARKAVTDAAAAVRSSAERLERLRQAERAARERLEEAAQALREGEARHQAAVRAEQAAQRALREV